MKEPAPGSVQRQLWNTWNTTYRDNYVNPVSQRQAEVIHQWIDMLRLPSPEIIEIGCGTGWFCKQLTQRGRVTGIDLADQVIERARSRVPEAKFLAGDIEAIELPSEHFHVAIGLEVIAHVRDARTFLKKVARVLKPSGHLMLATQNPFVVKRNELAPPAPGQLRNWLTRTELKRVLSDQFLIQSIRTVAPRGHGGVLRLVNSPKLTRAAEALIGTDNVSRLKEHLGFGYSIMVLARRV